MTIEDYMSPTIYDISQKLAVSYDEADRIANIVLEACANSEENYVGNGYIVERDD